MREKRPRVCFAQSPALKAPAPNSSLTAPLLWFTDAGGSCPSLAGREPGCDHVSLLPTYFSLSPSHFDIRSEDDTEKKVELLASVATALAR